ncbi:MAG: hypothetical protein SV775_08915, partial [Thermodesulfobacteriota bacterium]|nr:hypothetical protein [Thermodesulfobacteriota bacterium]
MQTAPFIIGKQSDSLFSIHPLGMRLGEAEKFNVDAGLPTAESIHEKTVFLSTLAVVVKNQNAAQSGCPDLLVSSVAVGTQDKTDATMFGNVSARNASLIGHETDVLPNSPRPDQGIDCTKDLLSISGPDVLRGEEEIDGGGTSSYEGMTVQKECLEVGSVKLNRTAQIRGQVSEQAR